MEPVSFVISIAGLFSQTVECFHYVKAAKNSGVDSQTAIFTLRSLQMRLARWGGALGINGSMDDVSLRVKLNATAEDFADARSFMNQIVSLVNEAETKCKAFNRKGVNGSIGTEHSPVSDSELTRKMGDMAVKGHKSASFLQKTSWALYGEERVEKLITGIANLVSALEQLFPGSADERRKLAEQEAAELSAYTSQLLPLLKQLAAKEETRDRRLEEAVESRENDRRAASANGPITNNWNGVNHGHRFGGGYIHNGHFTAGSR